MLRNYTSYKVAYQLAQRVDKADSEVETELKIAERELDALGRFKADLMTFTRYYEFMPQIVDYASRDLEMLSLYARHLAPLLREQTPDDDPIDLSSVELSHYRLSKTKQQDLRLVKEGATGLNAASALGTGRPHTKEEIWLSQLIVRLNELFITDGLTDRDLINYAQTIADKMLENTHVMKQVANNSPEQVMLGDFPGAVDDAVIDANDVHQNQMMQYLNNREIQAGFQRVVLDILNAWKKFICPRIVGTSSSLDHAKTSRTGVNGPTTALSRMPLAGAEAKLPPSEISCP